MAKDLTAAGRDTGPHQEEDEGLLLLEKVHTKAGGIWEVLVSVEAGR